MRDGGAGGALAALKKVRLDIGDPDAVAFALREARARALRCMAAMSTR